MPVLILITVVTMLICEGLGLPGGLVFLTPLAMGVLFLLLGLIPIKCFLPLILALLPFARTPVPGWPLRVSLADFALSLALLAWIWKKSHEPRHVMAPRDSGNGSGYLRMTVILFLSVAVFSFVLACLADRADIAVLLGLAKTAFLCLWCFMVGILAEGEDDFTPILLPWLIVACGQALVSVFAVAGLQFGLHLPFTFPFLFDGRGRGTMLDPNAFAAYMNTTIFLALSMLAIARTRWQRSIAGAALAACALGLMSSASISGYLGFLTGFALLIVLSKKERVLRRDGWRLVITMFALATLFLVIKGDLAGMIAYRLSRDDPSFRLRLWGKSIRLFLAHPLFGIGRGGFIAAQDPHTIGLMGIAHNTFLGLAAELGLTGVVVFFTLTMKTVATLVSAPAGPARPLCYGLVSALVALLIQGMAINIEHARVIWVIIGLTIALARKWRPRDRIDLNLPAGGCHGDHDTPPKKFKLLECTTIDITIKSFLVPLIETANELGWDVRTACRLTMPGQPGFGAAFAYDVPFSRRVLSPSNLRALFVLRRLLKAGRFDLLHLHTPVAAFFGRLAAASLGARRPQVIYTAHGLHFQARACRWTCTIYRLAERFAARWTEVIVVMNDEDEEAARKYRLGARVARINGVGVDTDEFSPERFSEAEKHGWLKENNIVPGTHIIVMIAEMIPRKRHVDAIEAMKIVCGGRNDVLLLLVGHGRLCTRLQHLAAEAGLADAVRFLGYRTDICSILAACDLMLHPAEQEGLPRAVLEAMSMTVPVVGCRVRGVEDLLCEGAGILVEPRAPAQLAEAMDYLLHQAEARHKMGLLGREQVLRKYALQKITAAYRDLFLSFSR